MLRTILVTSLSTGLAVTASLLPVVLAASPASAAATCDGQAATIVGTPGQARLDGTEGPDVIVSNGAQDVYAGEGADLVCLTGGDAFVELDATNELYDTGTLATDRVIGSGGDDLVASGGNPDIVDIPGDLENSDVYELGPGDSTVTFIGYPTGAIDGGSGRDRMFVLAYGDTLAIDVPGRSIGFSGRPTATLAGIESFHLDSSGYDRLQFRGGPADEAVHVYPLGTPGEFSGVPRSGDIRTGGGNDVVDLPSGMSTLLDGGPGHDRLNYVAVSRFRASFGVAPGVLRGQGVVARSFEAIRLLKLDDLKVRGSHRSDRIDANACTATIDGLKGSDTITVSTPAFCRSGARHVVRGGPGDDRVLAGRGRDLLIGGPGRDLARGGQGVDRCVAERTRTCERR